MRNVEILGLVVALAIAVAFLYATDKLAQRKGRPQMWPLGALGPIGLLVVALVPAKSDPKARSGS